MEGGNLECWRDGRWEGGVLEYRSDGVLDLAIQELGNY